MTKQTLLHLRKGVLLGDESMVQVALADGADVNLKDDLGLTPLMVAALQGHVQICELLIGAGADVASRCPDGVDAVAFAVRAGHDALANRLLAHLANSDGEASATVNDAVVADTISEELAAWIDRAHDIFEDILGSITPKEAEIWRMRYGPNGRQMTLESIGKRFNLSRQRISQILAKTQRKLRHPSRSGRMRMLVNEALTRVDSGAFTLEDLRWRCMHKNVGFGLFVYGLAVPKDVPLSSDAP